jgi:hypothetical protein
LDDSDLKSDTYRENRIRKEKRTMLVQEWGEEEGTGEYKRWKQDRDQAKKMAGIKRKSGMHQLKEWAGVPATYPKTKARNKVLKKTLRRFPMESEATRCAAFECDEPATGAGWTCRRQERRCQAHAHHLCKGVLTPCRCSVEKDTTEKQKRAEEDKLKVGTRICIDTEDEGWVEGEIIVIKPMRFKRGEKRNRRQNVIKTSETHDTIHGYHVGGEVGEVQLHEMDWWTVVEGEEDNESGEDNSDGKEEGEGRRDAKTPKGQGK